MKIQKKCIDSLPSLSKNHGPPEPVVLTRKVPKLWVKWGSMKEILCHGKVVTELKNFSVPLLLFPDLGKPSD